jgi:hypothetical protein
MGGRQIETMIEIDAPAARVWTLLTDFGRMADWNPFITAISGELREGARLAVRIAPPGKAAMRFAPVVLAARPAEELRWRGSVLVRGLLDGEHYFLLEPLGDGRTRLTQGERFSGVLAGLIGGMLPATLRGFEAMNATLKAQAEATR